MRLLLAAALAVLAEGRAQEPRPADEPAPDLELLEYLGSWQENDEEWLVVAEWQRRERRQRREPPPEKADDEGE